MIRSSNDFCKCASWKREVLYLVPMSMDQVKILSDENNVF